MWKPWTEIKIQLKWLNCSSGMEKLALELEVRVARFFWWYCTEIIPLKINHSKRNLQYPSIHICDIITYNLGFWKYKLNLKKVEAINLVTSKTNAQKLKLHKNFKIIIPAIYWYFSPTITQVKININSGHSLIEWTKR